MIFMLSRARFLEAEEPRRTTSGADHGHSDGHDDDDEFGAKRFQHY
jgi:hypothetical protein